MLRHELVGSRTQYFNIPELYRYGIHMGVGDAENFTLF